MITSSRLMSSASQTLKVKWIAVQFASTYLFQLGDVPLILVLIPPLNWSLFDFDFDPKKLLVDHCGVPLSFFTPPTAVSCVAWNLWQTSSKIMLQWPLKAMPLIMTIWICWARHWKRILSFVRLVWVTTAYLYLPLLETRAQLNSWLILIWVLTSGTTLYESNCRRRSSLLSILNAIPL